MNAQEAATLCRYVAACCPQQKIDEFTPAVWADLLVDVRLADAKEAVRTVLGKQPFIAPAEIITEAKRIRAKRIADHPPLTPPPGPDGEALSPAETNAWLREAHRRIGDGEVIDCDAAYGELKPRHLPDIRALMPAVSDEETTDA